MRNVQFNSNRAPPAASCGRVPSRLPSRRYPWRRRRCAAGRAEPSGGASEGIGSRDAANFTGLVLDYIETYRNENLQENMRLKALAEIYTMHSFALLCSLKQGRPKYHCTMLPKMQWKHGYFLSADFGTVFGEFRVFRSSGTLSTSSSAS